MHARTYDEYTALVLASGTKSNLEIVECLLEAGAEVNAKNVNGWTALHVASIGNQIETMHILLAAGADINVRTKALSSPLLMATTDGYTTSSTIFVRRWG